MRNIKHFFTKLITVTKDSKSKKLFRKFADQYYITGMLSLPQREILNIEGSKYQLLIPNEIYLSHVMHHILPNQQIINFINHLANNSNIKFKKKLRQISKHYKNFGWLSIKQRTLIYVSSYKLNKKLPVEFKLLTSDLEELKHIDRLII